MEADEDIVDSEVEGVGKRDGTWPRASRTRWPNASQVRGRRALRTWRRSLACFPPCVPPSPFSVGWPRRNPAATVRGNPRQRTWRPRRGGTRGGAPGGLGAAAAEQGGGDRGRGRRWLRCAQATAAWRRAAARGRPRIDGARAARAAALGERWRAEAAAREQ